MNLDNLHKVMKGDMTIDQACEGMTDDFEIGHVSHRKDGDYKKVAQGKWVPVKAGGGQGQMGAKKEDGAEKPQAGQQGKDQNKNVLTSADDVNWDIIEQVQKEAYKANKTHGVPEMMEKYDITQIQKFANANVDTGFANVDGIRGYLKKKAGLPGGVDLNVASKELAKFNNWQNARDIWRRYENKELDVDDTGHFYVPESARPKAEGEDFIDDDNNGSIGLEDAAPGIAKKAVELAQRDYTDVPGRVLTRDTKIKLSQIKQEQTQDKTYNVGETSQRKDGLYKKVAPGKWEPVKGGGGAGAPAAGNGRTDGGLVWRSPDNKHRIHEDNSSGKTKYTLYERRDNYSRTIGEYDSPEAAVAAGEKINASAGGNKPEPIALNEREQGEANRVMENLKNFDEKYTDRTKVRMKPGKNDHWDVFYGGKKIATMIGSVMQRDTAKKMGWFGEKG